VSSGDAGAVTMRDVLAVLRMAGGASVDAEGHVWSPYQWLAADADGNGHVGLSDAVGLLRHAVGLPGATPTWAFVDERDLTMPTRANASPGPVPESLTVDTTMPIGLVGILRGDVDGSRMPAAGASMLDDAYFTELVDELTAVDPSAGISLGQWGIYPS
jgi:hypothetical protein